MEPLDRSRIARRAARDIPEGAYVNLGVGIPGLVAGAIPQDRDVILHSENGILGLGPRPPEGQEDPEVCDASKNPVTLRVGASVFSHSDSFMMVRGGHLDLALLGAFEVSQQGDIANWKAPGSKRAPAVGGAMDLAVGSKAVWVLMDHTTRDGRPRLLERCSYPLTAAGVVNRIFTNLCVIDVIDGGFVVREMIPGLSLEALQKRTGAPLKLDPQWCELRAEAGAHAAA